MASILIIDDELIFAKNAAKFLEKSNHEIMTAGTAADGMIAIEKNPPDIIVLDYKLPDMDGLDVISQIRKLDAKVPIIMITGHGSIALAVDAMKAGANDLMTKPIALGELRERIYQLSQRQRETTRLQYYEARERNLGSLDEIVGNSQAVRDLKERITKIAAIDTGDNLPPVLIIGETGTGKELVARSCHYCSRRSDKPFIEVNCAAIPENLLESELLGHERGAFTDAKERKIGLFEAADGGTLFLDEVGEIPHSLQAKLLKVIEEGRFRRLGSVQERHVNIQIIAATNQDLEERIRQGLFRADLYFRLRVLQILTPPLRAREGDLLLLARHFLDAFSRRYRKSDLAFSAEAERSMSLHSWPGNVRELRNIIEQAVLLANGLQIGSTDLLLNSSNQSYNDSFSKKDDLQNSKHFSESSLDQVERKLLNNALIETKGNVSKAAVLLGISRDTLRYRMGKHAMNSTSFTD
jgi:DNA-binding NtrC family response regulator